MISTYDTSFNFLQRFVDLVIAFLAFVLAYYIRFHVMLGKVNIDFLFLKFGIIVAALTLYFFHKSGLYLSQRFSSRSKEIVTLVGSNTQVFVGIIVVIYFLAPDRVSRIMLVLFYALSTVLLILIRLIVRNFLRYMRIHGRNLRHVLLVGDGKQLEEFIQKIRLYKDSGIRIAGWAESNGLAETHNIKSQNDSVKQVLRNNKYDLIIVGFSGHKIEQGNLILKENYDTLTPIKILPDISYSMVGTQIDDFEGLPMLSVNQPRISELDRFSKRLFDFTACFIGVVLISPLLLLIATLVKLTSPGPVLYGQERVGLDGKNFMMWKFRSMRMAQDNEDQTVWDSKNNPRKTKFGSLLRKTSLDELPQLFNVLLGNMSLVGPRPERPFFVNKFKEEIPSYMLRHKMKAGITGWAQINGWRGDTSIERRIECDIYYIKNWSLWLDLKIIFLTFWKGFFNKNAY